MQHRNAVNKIDSILSIRYKRCILVGVNYILMKEYLVAFNIKESIAYALPLELYYITYIIFALTNTPLTDDGLTIFVAFGLLLASITMLKLMKDLEKTPKVSIHVIIVLLLAWLAVYLKPILGIEIITALLLIYVTTYYMVVIKIRKELSQDTDNKS